MNSKIWIWAARKKVVLVWGFLALTAVGVGWMTPGLAGDSPRLPMHFSGLLNDYTPASVNGVSIKGGPYEMHGKWEMNLDRDRDTARFSAAITMETSEVVNSGPIFDPGNLGAHTHHISVKDGVIHDGPTDWMTMCPTKPAVAGGFAVTGTAYVTGNGSNVPFGNPSPVTICILGGTNTLIPGTAYVEFSNFTLTIGPPASAHFGPQAIHGVVSSCSGRWGDERQDCKVGVVE